MDLTYHVAALDAEAGERGGEAEAAGPGLPPRPGRRVAGGGHDSGAVRVDERGPVEEGEGRERRVVGGAEHGALHHPPARRRRASTRRGSRAGSETRDARGGFVFGFRVR